MLRRFALAAALLVTAPAGAGAQSLVAVAVPPSGDGVLRAPIGGAGAFAIAVVNIGSEKVPPIPTAEPLLVTVDLPLHPPPWFRQGTTACSRSTTKGTACSP